MKRYELLVIAREQAAKLWVERELLKLGGGGYLTVRKSAGSGDTASHAHSSRAAGAV